MLWVIVAVLVVIAVVGAAAYVILTAPPAVNKYQLELWYNNDGHYGDTEDEIATVLKSSIEECGLVAVTLRSDPWAVYRQNWVAGTMPMFLLGWYPDYFDTDDYISPFLSTAGATSLGSFYSNATMDTWITEEQTTTVAATRSARFADIQDKLAEDVPYIPLFTGTAQVAYVAGIQDVELHPVSYKWFIIDKPAATELDASTTDRIITLDPASAYDYFSIEIINQVFDTLLVYEPVEASLMPGLAQEIPTVANGLVSADGTDYTYNLKPGITFHDGTPLTAQVVADSINRVIRLDIGGSAAFLLYDVGKLGRDAANNNNTAPGVIEVVDADTITFHLSQPVSFFNDLMAFSVAAPVPPSYNQDGEQPSTVGSVIGTGPYELTQHTENQLVVLSRNTAYHTPGLYASFGIPTIPVEDQVTINIRSTATALKNDIETQAVDVVYRTLDPTDLVDLQNRQTQLGITVDVGLSPFIRYIVINTETITEPRIRQAIAYSVDRAQIDQVVFNGLVEPLYSMVPSNMPYASTVFQQAYGDANCDEANALLGELGYGFVQPVVWIARDET
jgi:peptide/nickel transport system substrate-binding protein